MDSLKVRDWWGGGGFLRGVLRFVPFIIEVWALQGGFGS